jgi:hypothetical protein
MAKRVDDEAQEGRQTHEFKIGAFSSGTGVFEYLSYLPV